MCILTQGAQDIFKELPHMYVHPHDLKKAVEQGGNYKHLFLSTSNDFQEEEYLISQALIRSQKRLAKLCI